MHTAEEEEGLGDGGKDALAPDYESFVGLDRLQELDLSLNNLVELPEQLFCPLEALRTLNLSRNGFEDLDELKIRESECQVEI